MSKDIWHITNQDENTTDVPEEEGFVILIGHWTSCLWYGGETPEPIFWENVKKWCYLDDLLALETELDRTRKALDVAVDALKSAHEYYEHCVEREKQPYEEINWDCTAMNMDNDISEALDQITALEQKD